MSEPLVLGIETSCDETGIGIVRGTTLLANAIASSMEEQARYGGVVPEIAARAHLEAFRPTLDAAVAEAGISLDQLDAIAVTAGQGSRCAHGRSRGCEGALPVAGQAAVRGGTTWSATWASTCWPMGAGAADHRPARLRRAHLAAAGARPARRRGAARRVGGRRGRRGLRQGRANCSAFPIREARRSIARPRAGTRPPSASPAGSPRPGPGGATANDFSFSGLKTAVARWVSGRAATRRGRPGRGLSRRLPRGRRRRAHARRRSRPAGSSGCRACCSVAASSPTRALRELATRTRGRRRDRPAHPAPVAVHRQRRDDIAALGAPAGRRRSRPVGPRLRSGFHTARHRRAGLTGVDRHRRAWEPDGMTDTPPPVPPVPPAGSVPPPPPQYGQQQPYPPQQQYPGQPYGVQPYRTDRGPTRSRSWRSCSRSWSRSAGIICGHIALGQIRRTGEAGHGLALAGTVLGLRVHGADGAVRDHLCRGDRRVRRPPRLLELFELLAPTPLPGRHASVDSLSAYCQDERRKAPHRLKEHSDMSDATPPPPAPEPPATPPAAPAYAPAAAGPKPDSQSRLVHRRPRRPGLLLGSDPRSAGRESRRSSSAVIARKREPAAPEVDVIVGVIAGAVAALIGLITLIGWIISLVYLASLGSIVSTY